MDISVIVVKGEFLDFEKVFKVQMGVFFGVMILCVNCFVFLIQWSEGEWKVMFEFWFVFCECLFEEVLFLVDLEGIIMGGFLSVGLRFLGKFIVDVQLVSVFREVMMGRYLQYEELIMLFKCVFLF